MSNDPRVAPPQKDLLEQLFQEHMGMAPTERERARYEEFIIRRRDAEALRNAELRLLQQQAEEYKASIEAQQSIAQRLAMMQAQQGQADHAVDALNYAVQNSKSFVAKKPMFPNVGKPFQPAEPARLDDMTDAGRQAHDYALTNMNQIARAKYEPIFDLLDIKLRFTNASMSNSVKQWIIAKMGKDGRMIRQEWTAPSKDPGCSLLTWDAMLGELLDEVSRRDGITVDNSADTQGAGQQVPSSAGHP